MNIPAFSLAGLLIAVTAAYGSVGFRQVTIPDPAGKPMTAGIWYPSSGAPSAQSIGMFTQVVVANGKIQGKQLPLILISHGTSGSLASHYDTAFSLAEGGFVVAAVTHTGSNYMDQSYAGNKKDLIDRPRQIKCLTDFMLTTWAGHSHIDTTRIGIFGVSLGGFTALVEIGGTPDLGRMAQLCNNRPTAPECNFIRQRHGDQLERVTEYPVWTHDERIKAAVIVAPAVSFLFGADSLRDVHVPVQLWRAENDTQAPDQWNSAIVRQELPVHPEEHVVPAVDHFVFLAPCSDSLARSAPQICRDPAGFNRADFHKDFNHSIIAFFQRSFMKTDAKARSLGRNLGGTDGISRGFFPTGTCKD